MNNAVLVLKDGTVIKGKGIGKEGIACGEIVFNTSMTGYEEAITDPSYKYQILLFTYPLIGNYGVNFENFESEKIQCSGIIVKELCEKFSHPFAKKSLNEFLKENNVTGISNVDTRFLTRKIRNFGVMNAIIKFPYDESEVEELKEKAKNLKDISQLDLVREVTTKEVKFYYQGKSKNIVLIDCGEKKSIIEKILEKGVNVIQVPAFYDADKILQYNPSGIVVSNGPGDPIKADYVIKTVRELLKEKIPIFGICLGHQIIGLALGARTYKLKFGHHGSNHPVKDLETGKCYITSQNHNFAIDEESAKEANIKITHINLNDNSVEGIKYDNGSKIFSVQYHPEAHPGPHDSYYLFEKFVENLKK